MAAAEWLCICCTAVFLLLFSIISKGPILGVASGVPQLRFGWPFALYRWSAVCIDGLSWICYVDLLCLDGAQLQFCDLLVAFGSARNHSRMAAAGLLLVLRIGCPTDILLLVLGGSVGLLAQWFGLVSYLPLVQNGPSRVAVVKIRLPWVILNSAAVFCCCLFLFFVFWFGSVDCGWLLTNYHLQAHSFPFPFPLVFTDVFPYSVFINKVLFLR